MFLNRISVTILLLALSFMQNANAVNYPPTGPLGVFSGGSFGTYLQNIITNPCPSGQVVTGFSTGAATYGQPICIGFTLAAGTTGDTLRYNGSDWVANNIIYNNGTNVAIGDVSPASLLDVRGVLTVNPNAYGDAINFYNGYKIRTVGGGGLQLQGSPYVAIGNTAGNNGATFSIGNTGAAMLTLYPDVGQEGIYISGRNFIVDELSNVGIGTVNPGANLEISSTSDNLLRLNKASGTNWNYIEWSKAGARKYWQGINLAGDYVIQPDFNTGKLLFSGSNIGIAVANPGYRLDVASGYVNSTSGYCIGGSCIQAWSGITSQLVGPVGYFARYNNSGIMSSSSLFESGSKLYIGNVPAILTGTVANPGYITILSPTTTSATNPFLVLSQTGGQECRIWVSATGQLQSSCIWGSAIALSGLTPNQILRTGTNGTSITGSIMYDTGSNIGIGTSTPGAKLEVVGQIKITGGSPGLNKVLTSDATGLATWQNPAAIVVPVTSVFGRTGDILSLSGDYVAGKITNVPSGTISATNVQAALNELDVDKQVVLTGAASTVAIANLTPSFALVSDGAGKIAASTTISDTELSSLDGISSNIQSQLNGKEPTITSGVSTQYWRGDKSWQTLNTAAVAESTNLYFTNARVASALTGAISTTLTTNLTASRALASDVSGKVAVASPTLTELNYLTGLTNNVQVQLNTKAPLASPVLTGTPTAPTAAIGTNTTQLATTAFVAAATSISALSGTVWTLSGNTIGANDFIGTINTQALVIKTNNLEKIRIQTGGEVGIGTSTPRGILDVNLGVNGSGNGKSIFLTAQSGATAGNNHGGTIYLTPGLKSGTGTTGVVSIGFTPAEIAAAPWLGANALYSKGYGYFSQGYIAGNGYGMNWGTSTATLRGNGASSTADYIALRTNSIDRLYINGTGNVGIGTNNPLARLTLSGGSLQIIDGSQGNGKVLTSDATGLATWATYSICANGGINGNTCLGTSALENNTIGDSNTAIGSGALAKNDDGSMNTANGYAALYNNILGVENTAIGAFALYSNIDGEFNTAIGSNALAANDSGIRNVGVGAYVLEFNTLGSNNSALGFTAMSENTTGTNNTAIGSMALSTNSTGSHNSVLGRSSMFSNTSGNFNSTLGSTSLYTNTTGNYNTAIGYSALYSNNTGNGNTANGYTALMGNINGSNNSAFGNLAGGGQTSGSNNTFIGYNTFVSTGTLSNVTLLGANAVGTISNVVIIGSGANVGIGTSAPGAKLEVAGQVKITGGSPGLNKVLTSDATGLATWVTPSAGQVTSVFGRTGDVIGASGDYTAGQITNVAAGNIASTNVQTALNELDTEKQAVITGGASTITSANLTVSRALASDASGKVAVASSTLTELNYLTGLTNNVQVQLNTKAPLASPALTGTPTAPTAAIGTNTTQIATTAFVKSIISTTGSLWTLSGNTAGANDFIGTTNNQDLVIKTNNTPRMYIGSGYISVGNTTHNSLLSISEPAINGLYNFDLRIGIEDVYDDFNVGKWASAFDDGGARSLFLTSQQGRYQQALVFSDTDATDTFFGLSSSVDSGATWNPVFVATQDGNVGIGTSAPGAKLEVAGQVKITGGSPGLNKVLTSDATGLATWVTPSAGQVTSVFGRTGDVIGASGDYTAGQITNVAAGNIASTNVQTALNELDTEKQAVITGGASTITSANLTVSRALASDASGKVAVASSTLTELNYLTGLTNNVQVQLNTKAPLASPALTGTPTAPTAAIGTNTTQIATTAFVTSATSVGVLSGSLWTLSGNTVGANDFIGTTNAQNLRFYSNGSQKMVLDTNGNLGIGIASPGVYKLYANGDSYISGSLSILGKLFVDSVVSRTVSNLTISGSILPDTAAPLTYRDIGSNGTRWNNLYLSGQITIGGGSPGAGKVLTSTNTTGIATWQTPATFTNLVTSVFGRTGAVVGANGDYTAANITNVAAGNIASTNVQTALNELDTEKQAVITGGASTITSANLTVSRALASDASGKVAVASSTLTELNYLTGLTNNVQVQLNTKAPLASPALTGTPTAPTAAGGTNTTQIATTAFVTSAVAAVGSNGWSLSGNSVGANDFIGTTNAVDLVMKRNNVQVGRFMSNGNLAFGQASLTANTTGFYNTAIGSGSLLSNTTGSGGIALGYEALRSSTTVSFQTAIGYQAMRNTVGSIDTKPNTAIGYQSLYGGSGTAVANTAYDNVAIGYQTMYGVNGTASTGYENVAVGNGAMMDITTGNSNTAVGFQSLLNTTTGCGNSALGYQSLYSNIGGCNNIGIGYRSLFTNTNGTYNTALGISALHTNNGSYNVATGYRALYANSAGTNNTANGSFALYNTTGNNNLAIGYLAGSGITSGSNNIAIGYDAQVATSTASNQLNLGNLIYGTGMTGSGAGNIGIGTSTPTAKLEVAGQVKITGGTPGVGKVLTSDATGLASWTTPSASAAYPCTASGAVSNNNLCYGSGALRVNSGGTENVAIGNESMLNTVSGYRNTGLGQASLKNNVDGYSNVALGFQSMYFNNYGSANISIGDRSLFSSEAYFNIAIGTEALYNNDTGSGNVVIGDRGLFQNLSGNGNVAIGYLAGTGNTSGTNNVFIGSHTRVGTGTLNNVTLIGANTTTSTGNVVIIGSGANVGIGTSLPVFKLDVNGDVQANGWVRTLGNVGWYSQSYGGGWHMTDTTWIRTYGSKSIYMNAGTFRTDGSLQVGPNGVTLNVPYSGSLAYYTNVLYASGSQGNVGIGTSSPSQRLHVNGNVLATAYLTTSDKNLKNNIEILDGSLAKILSLRGYSFKWNSTGRDDVGIIAQEVEKVYPSLVHTDPKSGYKSVEYANLIAPMIEAMREQQAKIDSQQKEIDELKSAIQSIQSSLQK